MKIHKKLRARCSHRALLAFFCCTVSVSSHAQSAFDGLRFGIEATYSETSFRVDASKPKEAALADTRARVSRGEAELANASAELTRQRAVFEARSRALADGQQALRALEKQAAADPRVAARLAPMIGQMQQETAQGAASLQAYSTAIKTGEQAADAGRLRLAEGNRLAAEISAFPGVSTTVVPITSVRLSLGWGTSWATGIGGIHLGGDVDADPGTGDALVRVPAHFDTRIETGPSFGASARLGWIPVAWAMPYFTAGVETQKLRIERGTTRSNQQFTGLRLGVGVEFSISDNNIIRVGYDHTMTSDISFSGAGVTPSRETYRIGLVRRF